MSIADVIEWGSNWRFYASKVVRRPWDLERGTSTDNNNLPNYFGR